MGKQSSRKRKNAVKGISIFLAVAILVGGIGGYSLFHVNAQGVLTGLESKVSGKVSKNEAFVILEVVPDGSQGEIGNLIKGQEKEFLPQGDTLADRSAYMAELETKYATYIGKDKPFIKNEDYREAFFVADTADWNVMELQPEQYVTESIKGSYEPATDEYGNYKENITGFQENSAGSYDVQFDTNMRTDTSESLYQQKYVSVNGSSKYRLEETTDDASLPRYYIRSYEYKGAGNGGYEPILDGTKPYSYVPQGGQLYKFVADDTKPESLVEVGKIYYKGGITSQDCLRTKVLQSANSASLQIQVNTVTESELQSYDTANTDMVYLCADTTNSGKAYRNKTAVWEKIQPLVAAKVPCVLDAQTGIASVCGSYADGYTGQADFVKENLYIVQTKSGEVRLPLYADFEKKISDTQGVSEVSDYVKKENTLRSGADKLSTDLTRAFLMQYVIDFSGQRNLGVKDSYRVLEIQPTATKTQNSREVTKWDARADTRNFVLTKEKIADWASIPEEKRDSVEIIIDTMSTAEFVGKVDDLNKDYDLIYFGASVSDFNTQGNNANQKTVFNDVTMNGLIYMHTGDYVLAKPNITGILDTDYAGAYYYRNGRGNNKEKPCARKQNNLLYNTDDAGLYYFNQNRTQLQSGKLTQTLTNISQLTYVQEFDSIKNHQDVYGDLGVYRYSGNDITKTKMNDLLEFAQANYPIVVSDTLYDSGTGGKSVNENTVDNTSYLYRFLDQIKANENVFNVSEANAENSGIANYLNLQKPALLYFNPKLGDEPTKAVTNTVEVGNLFQDWSQMQVDTTSASVTGTYELKLGFMIESAVDASELTTYIPKFYMDLNADGKFLDSGTNGSSELVDCHIYNYETGAELNKDASGEYQLASGIKYVLTREIADTYVGVLTWKLQVAQQTNAAIRTSDVQYTKIQGNGKEEKVKVLQVTSTDNSSNPTTKISLQSDSSIQKYLTEVRRMTGLNFDITVQGGKTFGVDQKASSGQEYYDKYLKDYDMLILGFADIYKDISNGQHALDAIKIFIDSGKSVMFSHDVLSFINVSPDHSFQDINLSVFGWNEINQKEWGYHMNYAFRDILAMDRYGVVKSGEQSDLLQQGQHLTVNTDSLQAQVNPSTINKIRNSAFPLTGAGTVTGSFTDTFLTRDVSGGVLDSNYDVAYAAKTYNAADHTAQSYGQTHGYTNALLNEFIELRGYSKTNNNGIAYYNLKNDFMKVQDKAKGQTRVKVTSVNDGIITHYPYEIGDSFTTATTHYPYYQLNLDQDQDGDGQGDVVVWYCMSGDATNSNSNANTVYGNLPNDARNNYYIYNIGNVTYTGMGHSELVHDGADLETKLFINTIVAAYKAGVEDPTLKILETPSRTSAEKQYEYITYDDAINGKAITDTVSYYFTLSDPNLTSSQKTITMEYAYYDANGNRQILSDSDISVKDVTMGTGVTDGLYTSGYVYQVTLNGMAEKMAGVQEATLEAKVTSSFDYYGRQETHSATKQLKILKTQLMNLR